MEHLECGLQPSPPGCFTIVDKVKAKAKRGARYGFNGIGVVAAGEAREI